MPKFPTAFLLAVFLLSKSLPAQSIEGTTQQGVFQVAGGTATLEKATGGVWELRFTLPPGGAAGVWTKQLDPSKFPKPPHALSYAISAEVHPGIALPLAWEIKGSTGMQRIAVLARPDKAERGEPALDRAKIGIWNEGVLVVAHPGGDQTYTGLVRFEAQLQNWPWWRVALMDPSARWLGLFAAAMLASAATWFFRRVSPVDPLKDLPPRIQALGWGSAAALVSAAALALLADETTRAGQWPLTRAGILLASALLAALCTRLLAARSATPHEILWHTLISGLPVMAAADVHVWTVPQNWHDAFHLSRCGAALFLGIYHIGNIYRLATIRRPKDVPTGLRLMITPFLFGLLLALPNRDLMKTVGALLLGTGVHGPVALLTGRFLLLTIVHFLAALACLRSLQAFRRVRRQWPVLPVLAMAVCLAPWIADYGSGATPFPKALQPLFTLLCTMLSQGALWAEAYVLTGLLFQATRIGGGQAPFQFTTEAAQGFKKGALFGGWLMGLLLIGATVVGSEFWSKTQAAAPLASWTLMGALIFPLLKTIIESFDGSATFARRLWRNCSLSALPFRGAVLGASLAVAHSHLAINWAVDKRAGFGFCVGLLAYAGISLLRDVTLSLAGRGRIAPPRLYLVEATLGGAVGAALGFYFDATQTAVILQKLQIYLKVNTAPVPFEVYPLLSRWGFIPLGSYTGGARLLWNEALSGVISWGVAAWLFAINRSALTAIFQREWQPLKRMFSREGATELAEGTIYVLRWGLWMAPIIFTFLRQMHTPTWYNQDGGIRSLLALWQSLWLDGPAFERWSLNLFIAVLAYDFIRVLIWLDHMGLRVATLVNLSFLGMEKLDARVARFLGPAATSRFFPEGIKRFSTWMPLLVPFYIPTGAAWASAWAQSEAIRASSPSFLGIFWNQPFSHLLLEWAAVAAIATFAAAFRGQRIASLKLQNKVYALETAGAPRAILRSNSVELHRPSYEWLDPAGRAFFLSEAGNTWPVLGNFPQEIGPQTRWHREGHALVGKHSAHGLDTCFRVTLPDPSTALEAWTVTVSNPGPAPRTVCLSPYLEWLLTTANADRAHTQYARLFLELSTVPERAGFIATNRLNKMTGFFATDRLPEGVHLTRVDFIGRAGTLWDPQALRSLDWRSFHALAPAPTFDPITAMALSLQLAPGTQKTVRFWVGLASSHADAQALMLRWAPAISPVAEQPLTLGHGRRPDSGDYVRFEQNGRVMRVLTPFTPRPYDHTLSNALGHVVSLTQRGLHCSSNTNSQQNRLTPDWPDLVSREMPGEAFYLFDPEANEWFAPTFEPLRDSKSEYDAELGVDGVAIFHMRRGTLGTALSVFVPPDEPLGVYRLTVKNNGKKTRRLVCASYFQMVLAERPEHSGPLQHGPLGDGLWFANPRNNFRSGPAFAAMWPSPEAIATTRGAFFGADRGPAHPAWVQGVDSAGEDPAPVAAFRLTLELAPDEERELVVVLGQTATLPEAERLVALYTNPKHVTHQLEATRHWWNSFLGTLEITTSEPDIDSYLHWLKYQALAERIWARKGFYQASGAFGFRDQLQDAVNLIWVRPALAREQILLHAAQQFLEGDTVHWFFRTQDGRTGFAARTHASDNLLWLCWGVAEYLRMTGDNTLLEERVSYLDTEIPLPPLPAGRGGLGFFPLRSHVVESVYAHVRRALDLVLEHRMGAHGLPLIGTGDWNDSFDEIGDQGRGESVWLGCFLLHVLKELMPQFEARRDAGRYRRGISALSKALEECWRGDRYLRAIHDDGTEIGVFGGGAWEVDALTASWAVMAGLDGQRSRQAFDTAVKLLERDQVVLLGWPPVLDSTRPRFGRVAQYPPGVRENGMYCHGVQWLVGAARLLAERCQAEGDENAAAHYRATAVRLWRKISPLDRSADLYGGQPNKQSADMLTELEPGRMIWSGYTGAAGWMLRQTMEGLVGARLHNGQLVMPKDLDRPRGSFSILSVHRP